MAIKAVLVFLGLCGVAQAQLDEFLSFRKDYSQAVVRYRSRAQNIEGNCVINARYKDNTTSTSNVHFTLCGEYKKAVVLRKVKEKAFDSVFSIGPSFGFNVVKDSGQKQYWIQSIEPNSSVRDAVVREFGRFLDAPFAIQSQSIESFLDSKGFTLVRFDPETVGNARCWSIEFEFDRDGRRDRIVALLDRSLNYAVRQSKYQINGSKDTQILYEVDYQETPERLIFPKNVTIVDWDGREFHAQIETILEKSTPREDFLLPFFGLPDITAPPRPESRSFSNWLVMTIIAALGLVVATVLRRLASR